MIINSENISHQVCDNLSLTIENQSTDEDLRELIEIIEQLLIRHENISIKNFHTYYICKNLDLLNKIVTRWFLSKNEIYGSLHRI
jgi:nucleoid DNA-binding protein